MRSTRRRATIAAVRPETTTPADGRWDVDALRAGASICVVLAIPFRILAAVVGGGGAVAALFFVAFLALFVVGAGTAAWVQRTGTPMTHALATALGTFVVVEVVFVVVRLVRGTSIPWNAIVLTMSLVMLAGLVGGFLGNVLQAQGVEPSVRRRR